MSIRGFQRVFQGCVGEGELAEIAGDVTRSDLHEAAQLARRNKLFSVFFRTAARSAQNLEEFEDLAKADAKRAFEYNSSHIVSISRLSNILDEAELPYFFYKGPLSQKRLHNSFFMRASADIDVLVAPNAYALASRLLRDNGLKLPVELDRFWWWGVLGEQHFLLPEGVGSLDLHRKLQQPGAPAPRYPGRFLSCRETMSLGQGTVWVPSLIHSSLISAMNLVKGVQHKEPSGAHGYDLLQAMQLLETQGRVALWHEAALQGLESTLAFALIASNSAFGLAPDKVLLKRFPVFAAMDAGRLLLEPDHPEMSGVKRRTVLSALCGKKPSYLWESGYWMTSEFLRRLKI